MFIINITVNSDVTEQTQNEMFPVHIRWLEKYFNNGKFMMFGPYIDTDAHAGVIFAQTRSKDELQSILEEDCYYPEFARYDVREFNPKLITENFNTIRS
ncbi:YciI family protein [Proteus terrae]|uniref:YciI family protein n=1 Tax=Proteus terrae TaxID=1574161 RepID=UPI0035255F8A